MKNIMRVAVDGPSGAGKSTVAKAVSAKLGFEYIDTGAMYRAIALGMAREGISCSEDDRPRLKEMLERSTVDFENGHVMLNGEDISGLIRTQEISRLASDSSAIGIIREKLVKEQRLMGSKRSVIMDGRDIGTKVFPDAECKIFLTAEPKARAYRRYLELKIAYDKKKEQAQRDGLSGEELDKLVGKAPTEEQTLREVEERDYNDSHRAISPLTRAEDAVLLDSTHLSFEETVARFLSLVEEKAKGAN